VLRSGEPILSLSADDPNESEETRERRKRHQTGALILVPLSIKGQVIGAVSIVNRVHQRKFSQRDVDLAKALAGSAATALENVRLLQETRHHAERERLISEIATKMRNAPDVEGILQTTVQEIRRALGATHGVIRLRTQEPVLASDQEAGTR
jgi:GAF domain-containing protein